MENGRVYHGIYCISLALRHDPYDCLAGDTKHKENGSGIFAADRRWFYFMRNAESVALILLQNVCCQCRDLVGSALSAAVFRNFGIDPALQSAADTYPISCAAGGHFLCCSAP